MDYKKAESKYKTLMVIMVIILVASVAPMIFAVINYLGAQTAGEEIPSVSIGVAAVIFAVGLVAVLFLAKAMKAAKEQAMYDEFGVRRDAKNRLELNSADREALERQALEELERVIPRVALEKMIHKGSENPDADLASMIGISSIKHRIAEMKARMEFEDKSGNIAEAKKEGHHMVFTGSPGTGKTTIARIIAGLLYEYEYIDENKVIEVDGNFLKSGNADMTQTKVRYLCRAALGGVLFVDEAYALTQSGDEAGLQAVATLIKEMEDRRGQFVVILAGYTQEMKDMLDSNPGFRSRIKEYLDFPDYNDEELLTIFVKMAKEKKFDTSNIGGLTEVFSERMKKERALPSWGNARTVRNVLEEAIDHHAYRCTKGEVDKKDRYVLSEKDISKHPRETI